MQHFKSVLVLLTVLSVELEVRFSLSVNMFVIILFLAFLFQKHSISPSYSFINMSLVCELWNDYASTHYVNSLRTIINPQKVQGSTQGHFCQFLMRIWKRFPQKHEWNLQETKRHHITTQNNTKIGSIISIPNTESNTNQIIGISKC